MKILRRVSEIREATLSIRQSAVSLGFVPTMGFLHEGHLSLIREARKNNEQLMVSIFVNPTQFAQGEDFDTYPRDEERDFRLLKAEGVDWVFIPPFEEIYPPDFSTYVTPPKQSEGWCGASRPGHFRGVCTIVTILFNLVQPDRAYFGMKDAQQFAVIQQMAKDLKFPIEIIPCPTVREEDGLALSSRNVYLKGEERKKTLILSQALQHGMERFRQGIRDADAILHESTQMIQDMPDVRLDYLGIVDLDTFQSVKNVHPGNIMIGAIYVAKTRLIDNMIFEE